MRNMLRNSLAIAFFIIAIGVSYQLLTIQDVFAVESICPGGSSPNANVVFCDDFTDSTVHTPTFFSNWNVDNYCCWAYGVGTANATSTAQGGTKIRDPIIGPGSYDPGKCKLPHDCRGNGTTFVGNQGFASPNAWFSGYYWECCGNHYGNRRLPGNYTELYFRWYLYLNDGWNIPCASGTFCGSKLLMLSNSGINQSMGYMMVYSNGNGPDGQSRIDVYADTNEYRFQNQGNNLVLRRNQWYLYEWHVKLNTGSNFDGLSEFWIDPVTPGVPFSGPQTLRERHTNVRFTGGNGITATAWGTIGLSPNSNFGYCRPGQVTNNGANGAPPCPTSSGQVIMSQPDAYWKISNIVVSKAKIGPVGSVSSSNNPSAPTGLTIQ